MDDAGAGERAPGLKPAAARLAAGALDLARTRLELAGVELAEERERVKSLLALAVAGAVLAALAIAAISILVVAYFWDTYRYAAILALAVFMALGPRAVMTQSSSSSQCLNSSTLYGSAMSYAGLAMYSVRPGFTGAPSQRGPATR